MKAKNNAAKPDRFLAVHNGSISLILDLQKAQKILEEEHDWMNVKTELHEVVGSSMLGKKLFGCGVAKVLAGQVQAAMEEGIIKLWDLKGKINEHARHSRRRPWQRSRTFPMWRFCHPGALWK